ncbi:WS/DGAT domain-containing protein [Actinomadura sp. 9N407]|uniref:WS/DGAT domain-containing protein n=1 Tax=Actinomadura sp. 9N407 TaxID=3375154 RepID=UPI0037B78A48
MNECDSLFAAQEARHRRFAATWGTLVRLHGTPPSLEKVAAIVAERLGGLPALRLASSDPSCHRPRWRLRDDLDPRDHIAAVSTGTGPDALRRTVGDLLGRRIAADSPPWRLEILSGHSDEEFALLLRFNHALLDGVSGTLLLRQLLSPTAPSGLLSPRRPVPSRGSVRGLLSALGELRTPAQPLPVNVPSSPFRHVVWVDVPWEVAEAARGPAGAHRPTLNDVYLAAVSGALRRIMPGVPAGPAFAIVPVNVRSPESSSALGNCVSVLRTPLPVGLAQPAGRLAAVHAATSRAKGRDHATGLALLPRAANVSGTTARSLLARFMYSPRVGNLVCSNAPITREPLELAGRPVMQVVTMTVLPQSHGLSVMLHGYGDIITVSVLTDARRSEIAELFAQELRQEFYILANGHCPPAP